MATQRVVDMEVDPEFNIHTSYHNDFFLLKTRVTVNGENTQIKSVKEGSFEEPTLVYGSTINAKLWLIANSISPILHKLGVYHMDTFYYEQSPLFHVVFSSEACLKKFLLEMGSFKFGMEQELLSIFSEYLETTRFFKTESPQHLSVEVHPELFLVSPNLQKTKGADLYLITTDNASTFAAQWKNSKLFEFEPLYQEGAGPPCITAHPKGLRSAVPGQSVTFSVHATGAEPISYQWRWKPARDEQGGSEKWQLCDREWSHGNTLKIPSVQKLNEGSYQCVVSNCAGSQISVAAKLTIADPPCITTHPKGLKDAVPGQPVTFTVHATGTEPISYQWRWTLVGSGDASVKEEWQHCDVKRSDSHTLTISSVQKLNEGSYHCVVSNCAGSQSSDPAILTVAEHPSNWDGSQTSISAKASVAEPPKITTNPKESESIYPGKSVSFTVQAIGTKPLKYQWQWRPAGEEGESEEWKNISCDTSGSTFQQVGTGLKLTGFQACNAGYYRCVVSNSAGSETSQYTNLVAAAELVDLVNELQEVNNWIPFGLNLGIKISRLEAIEMQCGKIEECRTQLLISWQKQVVPTWSAVVKALMAIGMRVLVSKLAQKYGVPVPKPPNDEPLEQLINLSQQEESKAIRSVLLADVQKCRVDIRNVDVEIVDTKKRLRDSQTSKASVDENINQILCNISKLHEKVQSIADEKNIIKEKLKSKQQECQLLSEMQELATASMRDSKKQQEKEEAYRILVEEKNAKKRKKIDKLEQELQQKDSDLQSAQEEAKSLDEKLLQARAELERKHKEIRQLQKENEELACSYNIEKEKVSKLVQITVALTADKNKVEQQLMTTKDESELTSQHIEACNSSITSLSEKVEALSCSLKEKEATAAQLRSELQSSCQLVSSTAEQLLELLKLQPQIAELECKLQEAEYKKQQAVLEKRASVQEMEARKKLEVRLCAQVLADPPTITQHPELNGVAPGKPVTFTVRATGTEPLSYQWQWKPAGEGSKKEWQECNLKRFPGANSSMLTIPSVQKSNEGSYCCTISNPVGSQTSKPAVLSVVDPHSFASHSDPDTPTCLQNELPTPLKLRWKKRSNMLYGMSYPKTVQLHNNLYVGGGDSYRFSDSEMCTVQKYDQLNDTWSKLEQYGCYWFGMSAINGHLTVVGGRDIATRRLSKKVGVWEPSSQRWTQPYPPMITPRYRPEVATYHNYLLAAGGHDGGTSLTTVEVLDVRDGEQWLSVTQLPEPCSDMTSAIINDNWYIITNTKQVIYCSLPEICTQTLSESAATTAPARWQRLADTPLERTTAIAVSCSLLTVGGRHDNTASTAIHLYRPESNTWTEVGNLPTPRYYCSVTLLASGEFLVSGGRGQQGIFTTLVDIATLD